MIRRLISLKKRCLTVAVVLLSLFLGAQLGERQAFRKIEAAQTVLNLSLARESPQGIKVDTMGVTATIKYEEVLAGFLTELNGKYKLRVTEISIAPGGFVGDHNHLGPGIRQVTSGRMEYIMPDKTVIYGPGDYFFEAGDVSHRVVNKTGELSTHLLFEILPKDVVGPSLILPRDKAKH